MTDTPTRPSSSSRVPGWVWPLALALLVRLVGLGDDDFWSDEVHTFEALELPLGELVRERLAAGHLPLYFVLLDLWSEAFGSGHLALRLPSALVGALAVVPGWYLFRRLLPDRAAARWATTMLAVHPVWVELSREARMYPFVGLAFLVVALAIARGRDRTPHWTAWIAAVLGPLLHATWAFGLAALIAVAGVRRLRRKSVWGLFALSAAVLALSLPTADLPTHELVRRVWWREGAVYGLRQFAGAEVRGGLLWLYLPLALCWVPTLVAGVRDGERRVRVWGASVVGVVHVGVAVASFVASLPWGPTRYVALGVPGLIVLAAASHARLRAVCVALILLSIGVTTVDVLDVDRRASGEAAALGDDVSSDEGTTVPERARLLVLRHYYAHPREAP